MKKYNHTAVEKKWQSVWNKKKVYKTEDSSKKPKKYILDMFPYPSGEGLHVGHPKGYIATDIYSRMKRMQGYNVLHPMGFDAFGLPAENYAIKHKVHPEKSTAKNVANYKKQLQAIGLDYDWSREINTTDPKYYKWTQWIFLKLFEKGLAYESWEPINWCPSCQTGLANEDLEDGKCERCGSVVEKKPMRQWMLRITDYAERLLADLDALDWPESIKESQRNWIGKSEGAEIPFVVEGKTGKHTVNIFTTRPDTLFGVTYIVLAPEHVLVGDLKKSASNEKEIDAYIKEVKNKSDIERTAEGKEKTGVKIEGVFAVNPINQEKVPVFVADYVLAQYGTGAVMAVPAHDDRDFAFAKKYDLPIKAVVMPRYTDHKNPHVVGKQMAYRKSILAIVYDPKTQRYLHLRWKKHPWTTFIIGGIEGDESPTETARREVQEETGYKNLEFKKQIGPIRTEYFAAHKDVNRVSDSWTIFFELKNDEHEEISAIENETHEILWAPLKDIENKLTHSENEYLLNAIKGEKESAMTGFGILFDSKDFSGKKSEDVMREITNAAGGKWVTKYKLRDWVFSRQRYWGEPMPLVHTAEGKVVPLSEKDLPLTLPKVKSYAPTGTGESPLADIKKWVETTMKIEGEKKKVKRETNTMPQWAGSSWYYLRYMDPKNDKVLVDSQKEKYWGQVDMYVGGTEHATRHLIYARFWHKFLYDIGAVSTTEPFAKLKNQGLIMGEDGRKMSKRWGNVVNPDDVIKTYGADTLRLYEMFMGPFDASASWSTNSMIGSRRFIERVWRLAERVDKKAESKKSAAQIIHKTLKKVTEDIEEFRFNTAISSLMICLNALETEEKISLELFKTLLKMLSPFVPHVTESLWSEVGGKGLIVTTEWPKIDESLLVDDSVRIGVQVNGKVRADLEVAKDESEESVKNRALRLPEVEKWLENKAPKKVIYVKGKIVSIVL